MKLWMKFFETAEWLIKFRANTQRVIDEYSQMHQEMAKKNITLIDRNDQLLRGLAEARRELTEQKRFMQSIIQSGVDISMNHKDKSWAVFCINGKQAYVKFVDLERADIRDIISFMHKYEMHGAIDAPHFMLETISEMRRRL